MRHIYLITIAMLLSIATYAQSALSKRALKAYDNMFYQEASRLYQEVVNKEGGSPEELIRLADCYMKLNEYIDAELTYEKLFKAKPAQPQHIILKYAQVLAINERYDESLKYYAKYTQDARGKAFADAYANLNKFYRDSSEIYYRFLPINTLQSEFSPYPYKRGIVFVSNRNTGSVVKNVDGRNKTPYMDIYLAKDTMVLKNERVLNKAYDAYEASLGIKTFNDDFTPQTSNDSRTLGHFDTNYLLEDGTAKSFIEVVPFSKTINSRFHEGPVCFSKSYDTIFFTRNSSVKGNRKQGSDKVTRLQIFYAVKGKNGKYGDVKSFPFNSTEHSVGHPALSADGKRLYFVSDKKGGLGETDIYYSEIREHRFTEPVNAGKVINTPGSEMFPFINGDGSMFFASNGHPGLGGLDIFKAEFQNNAFNSPRNLGYPINSSKDDFGICATNPRGTGGYFSSNRMRGRSDDNIYSFVDSRPPSVLIKGIVKIKQYDENGKMFVEPLQGATVTLSPLGDQVTTDRTGTFEFFVSRGKLFTVEGEKDKVGKDRKEIDLVKGAVKDQYQIELILEKPLAVAEYSSKVLEAETQRPVNGALVYVYEVETQKTQKLRTDSTGSFKAQIQPNKTYIFRSNALGYFSDCYKVEAGARLKEEVLANALQLNRIQLNTTFEVKNLLYDYNSTEIRPDAAEVLDKVVRFLTEYPEIEVELGSHSDSRGGDDYNQKLSAQRAKSAVEYIVSQGVESSRISAKGYGETQLLNHCKNGVKCSDEEHQQNRRTEVKVTGINKAEDNEEEDHEVADPATIFKYLSDFNDCKVFKVGE